jgi:SAM-dependent methyltransferase
MNDVGRARMVDVLLPGRSRNIADTCDPERPTCPSLLVRRVADHVGLDGSQSVLDLGTGTGLLAIDFARYARRVVGIDPEPEMLRIARQRAERAGIAIEFIAGTLDEADARLGRFRLVTIGRAFRWADRSRTLHTLDMLVDAAGGVALFGETYPSVPANAWQPAFQAILDNYGTASLARERRQRHQNHEAVLLDSKFCHLERIAILEPRRTSIEQMVLRASSIGRTWQERRESRLDDMAHEVRSVLAPYAVDGMISEVLEGTALIARRR